MCVFSSYSHKMFPQCGFVSDCGKCAFPAIDFFSSNSMQLFKYKDCSSRECLRVFKICLEHIGWEKLTGI